MSTALVAVEPKPITIAEPTRWTQADVDLIAKQVCPAGIPEGELRLFIAKCQASGMNPLLGEAFCVKRKTNIGSRDNPRWIDVFAFTPGEQGMEARADRFSDFGGLRAAAVYEKDTISIDPSAGEVHHTFNPVADRGRLVGAWAIAYRNERKTPVEFVRLEEYSDARNPQWAQRPLTMLVKCARAAALRRAYPNAFTGVFAAEELDDAPADTPAELERANAPTTDRLADRLTAQAEASRPAALPAQVAIESTFTPTPAAQPEPAKVRRLTPVDDPPASPPSPAPKAPPAPAQAAPVAPTPLDPARFAVFGPRKGSAIDALSGIELAESVSLGEAKLPTLNAGQRAVVLTCLEAMKAELVRRIDAAGGQREPGSDDGETPF